MSGKKMVVSTKSMTNSTANTVHPAEKRYSGKDRDAVHPGINTVHPGVNRADPGANTVHARQSPIETTTGVDPGRAR